MKRASQIRRLCTLRRLEEQHRATLVEEARQTLQGIDGALKRSGEQRDQGRALVTESIAADCVEDRIAGMEEVENAKRRLRTLLTAKTRVEQQLLQSREEFLSKRTERRQADAVLDVRLQEEARTAERRSQSELDDWHRMAHHRPASLPAEDE